MNIISTKPLKNGNMRVTVDLVPGEHIQAIKPDAFYKTGYPVEDVIQGHIMLDSQQVTWCPLGQEWVS